MDAQVGAYERGQAGHVLLTHLVALCRELTDGGIGVDSRPQHDAVQDKAERAELVLSEMILKAGRRSEVVTLVTHCN
jgi:hypothetical protein